MEEEFQAMGLDTYKERGAVTDEYLQIYKDLWTKDDASFQGKFYQISDTGFEPNLFRSPTLRSGSVDTAALQCVGLPNSGMAGCPLACARPLSWNPKNWPKKSPNCEN